MNLVDQLSGKGFDCLCGNLRMAARAVTALYDRELRPLGLQASQLAVLWAIAGLPERTVKQVARHIAMDETTLLRNLRVLERAGWVAIEVGASDRRQRIVRLTDEGRALFARALPVWQKAQARVQKLIAGELGEMNRQLVRLSRLAA